MGGDKSFTEIMDVLRTKNAVISIIIIDGETITDLTKLLALAPEQGDWETQVIYVQDQAAKECTIHRPWFYLLNGEDNIIEDVIFLAGYINQMLPKLRLVLVSQTDLSETCRNLSSTCLYLKDLA